MEGPGSDPQGSILVFAEPAFSSLCPALKILMLLSSVTAAFLFRFLPSILDVWEREGRWFSLITVKDTRSLDTSYSHSGVFSPLCFTQVLKILLHILSQRHISPQTHEIPGPRNLRLI